MENQKLLAELEEQENATKITDFDISSDLAYLLPNEFKTPEKRKIDIETLAKIQKLQKEQGLLIDRKLVSNTLIPLINKICEIPAQIMKNSSHHFNDFQRDIILNNFNDKVGLIVDEFKKNLIDDIPKSK